MMSGVGFARIGHFFTTVARHAVPVGGVFGREWHPATAIAVYWLESVLLVLGTVWLCSLMQRRTAPKSVHDAKPADYGVRTPGKGIDPKEVMSFHLGSILIFGLFIGGILVMLVGNGQIEPLRWDEIREGAEAMALVIAIGIALDLWRFDRFTEADVRRRVDACMVRWGLFWMMGFFGTILMGFTGRPTIFFGFFMGLKVTFESWAHLARMFGWKSLKDREAEAARS
jgi:hypothetical protein